MDRSLDTLLSRFEREYMNMNSTSPERRTAIFRELRNLSGALDGRTLTEMTVADVQEHIGAQLARGIHPNSAKLRLVMIKTFVGWAHGAGLIDEAVTLQLKSVASPRGARKPKPKPYKASEVREFKRVLSTKYPVLPQTGVGSRALRRFTSGRVSKLYGPLWRYARRLQFEAQVALALEEGLRTIEMHRLTIPAMHYDNDQVVVLTAKQGPGSNVTRAIPYTNHARDCVREWLDLRSLLRVGHDHPWLALGQRGTLAQQTRPMTREQWRDALDVFPGKWDWHRFRHTAITYWLRAPVALEKVRIFAGHANIDQTLAYAEIASSDIDIAFGEAEAQFARTLGLAA